MEAWVQVDPNEHRPFVPLNAPEFVPIPNDDPELEELCI